jgi:hypothetical protein
MTTQDKTDIAILPLRDCFRTIIANKDAKALNYCVNYAQRALEVDKLRDVTADYAHTMRTQILYVLNNMAHWRGDIAKQVRASLKHHEKVLSK